MFKLKLQTKKEFVKKSELAYSYADPSVIVIIITFYSIFYPCFFFFYFFRSLDKIILWCVNLPEQALSDRYGPIVQFTS